MHIDAQRIRRRNKRLDHLLAMATLAIMEHLGRTEHALHAFDDHAQIEQPRDALAGAVDVVRPVVVGDAEVVELEFVGDDVDLAGTLDAELGLLGRVHGEQALGHHAVAAQLRLLLEEHYLRPILGRRNGGAQARGAAADHHDVGVDGGVGRGLGGYLRALGRRCGSLASRLGQRLVRIGLHALRSAPCQPESGKAAHGCRPGEKVPARDFHDSSFGFLPSLMQRPQGVGPCDRVVGGPMKPVCVFGRNRFRGGKSPPAPYLPLQG